MLWERELYFRGESQNEGFGGAGSGSLGRAAAESASAAWRRRRPKLRRRRAPCGGGCEGWGPHAQTERGAAPTALTAGPWDAKSLFPTSVGKHLSPA